MMGVGRMTNRMGRDSRLGQMELVIGDAIYRVRRRDKDYLNGLMDHILRENS